MEKYKLINNREESQYEYRIEIYTPHIQYRRRPGEIALTHTRVPVELRGKGIGNMLVKDTLDDIEKQDLRLIPLCSFVATYIKRHPEYKKLLKEDITIG